MGEVSARVTRNVKLPPGLSNSAECRHLGPGGLPGGYTSPLGPVAVLNVVGLAIAELKDEPATLASLEGETVDQRIQRRLSRWTPMTLEEPAS